jgi:rhodanese-related sulfurtransferase
VGASAVVPIEDVPVEEVWAKLKSDAKSVLVDVRTRAEWTFVGVPDLAPIGKQVLPIEWQSFPDNRIDPGFVDRLREGLELRGVGDDSELFFICRSGGRSQMAARAATAAGYSRCHNVAEGFEGPLDSNRHRGQVAGWKARGLPWVQR